MKNNMKIQIAAIMAVVLGLVTVIGNAAISAYAEHTISYEIKDEIGVSDNTVTTEYGTDGVYIPEDAINVEESSIEDEEINALGTYSLTSYVNALHYWDDKTYGVDYLEFTIPDAGRWRFDQTFARGELFQAFCEARSNPANWKYCTNNLGEPITWAFSTYEPVPFVYDYELERCAMQRAVETAMSNSHTRFDGLSADEVYIDLDSPYQYCQFSTELATCGEPSHGRSGDDGKAYQSPYAEGTAEHIIEGLMEDYSNDVRCSGRQDHRLAIIGADSSSARANRIGIGVIRINAVMSGDQVRIPAHTIVEVLMSDGRWEYNKLKANGLSEDDVTVIEEDGHGGLMPHYDTPTPVVDTYMPVTIRIIKGMDKLNLQDESRVQSGGGVWMDIGESYDLTDKWYYDSGSTIPLVKGMDYNPRLYSTDTSVATVDNGVVKAVGAGTCQIMSDCRTSGLSTTEGWLDGRLLTITVREPAPATTDQSETTTPSTGGSTSETTPTITPPAPIVNPTGGSGKGSTVVGGKKVAQTIKLKKTSYTYKYKKLKKSSKKFSIKPVVNGGKAHGKVTYKVTKYPKGGKKYIKVDKKGTVTLKKKAKKGTYKVKVTAAETAFFKSSSKTVTIRVK